MKCYSRWKYQCSVLPFTVITLVLFFSFLAYLASLSITLLRKHLILSFCFRRDATRRLSVLTIDFDHRIHESSMSIKLPTTYPLYAKSSDSICQFFFSFYILDSSKPDLVWDVSLFLVIWKVFQVIYLSFCSNFLEIIFANVSLILLLFVAITTVTHYCGNSTSDERIWTKSVDPFKKIGDSRNRWNLSENNLTSKLWIFM